MAVACRLSVEEIGRWAGRPPWSRCYVFGRGVAVGSGVPLPVRRIVRLGGKVVSFLARDFILIPKYLI